MMIYPTMELQNGRCVTLDKGRLDEAVIWHVDPVETARGFAAAGAEWMHVTDMNALAGTGDLTAGSATTLSLTGGLASSCSRTSTPMCTASMRRQAKRFGKSR